MILVYAPHKTSTVVHEGMPFKFGIEVDLIVHANGRKKLHLLLHLIHYIYQDLCFVFDCPSTFMLTQRDYLCERRLTITKQRK